MIREDNGSKFYVSTNEDDYKTCNSPPHEHEGKWYYLDEDKEMMGPYDNKDQAWEKWRLSLAYDLSLAPYIELLRFE